MPSKTPRDDPYEQADGYRIQLETEKHQSTLQLLFKAARLVDERALALVAAQRGAPKLRRSHTSLLPHIELEGTRITDLAERMGISKQAVSQLVDDLEGYGVLERVADPDDGRAKRVVFTALGRQGLLEGLATLRGMEADLEQQIGASRMRGLRLGLLALLQAVDEAAR